MNDPQMIAYSVKEVLTRMETKLDKVVDDVHELQLASAAQSAVARSHAAIWTAGVSAVTAGAALIVAFARP
jgi:hypothetical protein